jgi:hypothetical protein
MSCFAVVRPNCSYYPSPVADDFSYIEYIDFVASFASKEDATNFIDQAGKHIAKCVKEKMDYTGTFVDNINIPDAHFYDWLHENVKFRNGWQYGTTNKNNFKDKIGNYLREGSAKMDGYDPPEIEQTKGLFVVEIKDCCLDG